MASGWREIQVKPMVNKGQGVGNHFFFFSPQDCSLRSEPDRPDRLPCYWSLIASSILGSGFVYYEGGAIGVRTVNATSCGAIFQEIGKLLFGGYYEEVRDREHYIESPEWTRVE